MSTSARRCTAWAAVHSPSSTSSVPRSSMAFSHFRADQDGRLNEYPSSAQVDEDLQLLAGRVFALRTYGTGGSLGDVPRLAARYGISVAVGAWLDKDRATDKAQVDKAIALAQAYRNVVRVFVGNEVMLRGDLPLGEFTAYIDRVRQAVSVPVGTAETWATWLRFPELARHCDFLAVHLLPYWEGLDVEAAVDVAFPDLQGVQGAYPDQQVIIAAVGWPSDGPHRGNAVGPVSQRALVLSPLLAAAG